MCEEVERRDEPPSDDVAIAEEKMADRTAWWTGHDGTGMVQMYVDVCEEFGREAKADVMEEMERKNQEELEGLQANVKDAEESLGESDVREGLLAIARFYKRVGDREKAKEAYEKTAEKTVATGQKMDLAFERLQLALFAEDWKEVQEELHRAKVLFEQGGDWERKNRLKVYEALYLMATRDFDGAAKLFLDSIATFTCTELFNYQTFVFYTTVVSAVALERPRLKKEVIDSPEVLSVIGDIPHLADFVNALHDCRYDSFMEAFIPVADMVRADRYLNPHLRYFMREVRLVAYTQFLSSYKSVTLASMASHFGMSVEFLDQEISNFVATGRLNCKIDKVAGVIETNRPDAKNGMYRDVIKQGDHLLNQIQKLSRISDIE